MFITEDCFILASGADPNELWWYFNTGSWSNLFVNFIYEQTTKVAANKERVPCEFSAH